MVFTADRWSTRDAPSLRNHDRCRLEYARMWPSASARAAARSAPSSSAIAFPVDAARRMNSRYPCVCDATLRRRLAGEPVRRAGTGGTGVPLGNLLQQPVADLVVQCRLDPPVGLRFRPVDAVHGERKRRGRLVARLAGHAAHQGVEDRLVVVGCKRRATSGRNPASPEDHLPVLRLSRTRVRFSTRASQVQLRVSGSVELPAGGVRRARIVRAGRSDSLRAEHGGNRRPGC